MPTPPPLTRSSLPSSSPSSARLRRIAPSPVKIPPPPSCSSSPSHQRHAARLPHSHTALTALSNSPSTSRSTPSSTTSRRSPGTPASTTTGGDNKKTEKRRSKHSVFSKTSARFEHEGKGDVYEFEPLEMTKLSSPDTQIRTLFDLFERSTPPSIGIDKLGTRTTPSSSSYREKVARKTSPTRQESRIGVPLILDVRGEFGRLAADSRCKDSGYIEVPMVWAEFPNCEKSDKRKRQRTTSSSSCSSNSSCSSSYSSSNSSSSSSCPDCLGTDMRSEAGWTSCKKRSGSNLFSPGRFISRSQTRQKEKTVEKLRHIPSPIMVEFRTDIFPTEGREKIWRDDHKVDESTPRPRQRTISRSVLLSGKEAAPQESNLVTDNIGGRVLREDSAETFATFGNGLPCPVDTSEEVSGTTSSTKPDSLAVSTTDSRLDVENLEEDGWSFTLSAYERDDISVNTKGQIRKDSFFASSVIAAHVEELRLASDKLRTRTNTISGQKDFRHQPAAISTKTHSLWNPEFTLGVTLPSVAPPTASRPSTGSKFVPPAPHLQRMTRAIKANKLAGGEGGCDSPMSDTIITPQARRQPDTHCRMASSGQLGGAGSLEDTPAPMLMQAQRSSRLSMRPEAAVSEHDKILPSLPGSNAASGIRTGTVSSENPLTKDTSSSRSMDKHDVDATGDALRRVDKGLTVQLWVDQEGCRENRTTLKYLRSIKPSVFREREQKALSEAAAWCESPTRPECFQQSGCWEFGMDPRERDKWLFHHAALEGLPVLRRLTINNDDKHDFLPRGATLQIKEPGVYVVCGTEDRGKVEWKFEYLVQPKVSPISGEEIPNERIIVPLAFYASPSFFAPERALRTHLLNVFKKTLTPNIVSEKIRPPHIGKPPSSFAVPAPAPAPFPTSAPLASNSITQRPVSDQTPRPGTARQAVQSSTGDGNAIGLTMSGTGRKRAQTQTQPLPSSSSAGAAGSTPHPHTRSVSRTIGAIAKSIAGITLNSSNSTTSTPTKPYSEAGDTGMPGPTTPGGARPSSAGVSVHKFGTKAPTFGRSGSRAKTPTTASGPSSGILGGAASSPSSSDPTAGAKGRKRAASLFSRSRPFTPPVNITEMHPVPSIGANPALSTGSRNSGGGFVSQHTSSPANGKRTSMGISAVSAPVLAPPASENGLTQIGSAIISTSTLTLPLPLAHNSTSLSLPLRPLVPSKSHQRRSIPLSLPMDILGGPQASQSYVTNTSTKSGTITSGHPFLHPDSYMYGGGETTSPVPSSLSLSSSASSSRYECSASPMLATPSLSPMPSPLPSVHSISATPTSATILPNLTRSASSSSRPKTRPAQYERGFGGLHEQAKNVQVKLMHVQAQQDEGKQSSGIGMGMGISGLYPTPRRPAMKKRPSTAEPRLGMR
ncbi:hypothetical protein I316_03902 [Kwoniella heveanensis BCC8398]|uniref:Uncharacterized protein n=1 Tax=Kwoniella heveanensis BCC8398 TaxID=1296120 RepID=A0A1B9GTU0_9TREE|nr:hypothetical protein I316_03902 [Kwoniella heveanensis BCC8398]